VSAASDSQQLGSWTATPDGSAPKPGAAEATPRRTRTAFWSWSAARTPGELEPWRAAIDDLCDRRALPALAGWPWLSAFWESFRAGDDAVSVQLLERDGALVAAVPVWTGGAALRRTTCLENAHVPCWTAAVDESDPALAPQLVERLLAGVGADFLELRRLPLDSSLCRALLAAATAAGLSVLLHESPVGEVGLPLHGPWPAFEKTLSKNLRRDGRQIEKLQALGRVELEVVGGGPRLAAYLEECFALEARGWKGQAGTPVLSDPQARQFYWRLAARAGARGQLALYLLKLEGRVVAFEYDLRGGGRIECLKIGYDESLHRHSPGTILRLMLLRRAIERGEAHEYHLGRESEWKRRWSNETTRMGTLQIFASSARGQLAHMVPVMRGRLKQLPGVKQTVALTLEARAQLKAWTLRRLHRAS
jgi:CelD/BcsL family acetyltransferase involved in cellulose biosynthesis